MLFAISLSPQKVKAENFFLRIAFSTLIFLIGNVDEDVLGLEELGDVDEDAEYDGGEDESHGVQQRTGYVSGVPGLPTLIAIWHRAHLRISR